MKIQNTPANAGFLVGLLAGIFGAITVGISNSSSVSSLLKGCAVIALIAIAFAIESWRWRLKDMVTHIMWSISIGLLVTVLIYAAFNVI